MRGNLLNLLVLIVMFTVVTKGKFGLINKLKTNCQTYISQLQNVISVMCNNIANGTNAQVRDACNGCFQAAIRASNDQPSLVQMQNCATTYLTGTNYSQCIISIQGAAANEVNPLVGKCKTGYCGFVRCIRSTNANLLIYKCLDIVIGMVAPRYDDQLVALYKNTTSCILAEARCSSRNPISGEPRVIATTNNWNKICKPRIRNINALQITPSGELRIIAFSQSVSVGNYFCSGTTNVSLSESTWGNFTCRT